MPNTLKYTFDRGPAQFLGARGQRVKRGGEIDLTEGEVIDLSQRGFVLTPVDKRRSLPKDAKEVIEGNEVTTEE